MQFIGPLPDIEKYNGHFNTYFRTFLTEKSKSGTMHFRPENHTTQAPKTHLHRLGPFFDQLAAAWLDERLHNFTLEKSINWSKIDLHCEKISLTVRKFHAGGCCTHARSQAS